jgi:hypothetical protein
MGAIVLILLDGGAASQTASPPVSARTNAAAQAGTSRIAFLSDVPKARLPEGVRWQGELYVMNIDGSDMRRLARFASGFLPTWSPDGRTIAFDRAWARKGRPRPATGRVGSATTRSSS